MKKLLFILCFACIGSNINFAQTELWPKEDASWYYFRYTLGIETYVNYSIDRDTIIQGKDCQVYTKHKKYIDYISYYEYESNESVGKIICLEDSVLYNYNLASSDFDTIINFNANIGDFWHNFLPNSCQTDGQELSFTITLTDKSIENINGVDFNTYELTYTSPDIESPFSFKFHQLFGFIFGGELNEVDNCDFIEAPGTNTNCFLYHENEDDEFLYHRNQEIANRGCDYIPSLGINQQELHQISIINPIKNNEIIILNPDKQTIISIDLYNTLGQNINLEIEIRNDVIIAKTTENISKGIYVCKLNLGTGKVVEKKLVIE